MPKKQKRLTPTELLEMDTHHLNIQLCDAKILVLRARQEITELKYREAMRNLATEVTTVNQEHRGRTDTLQGYVNTLGAKYKVDFDRATYDTVTGIISEQGG